MNASLTAVILAAGRGSRMKDRTADRPKCLLELAGKPLLRWQLEALREGGVEDILLVRGYMGHLLDPAVLPWAGQVCTVDNPRWDSSNMLRTLLCADPFVRQAFADGTQRVLVCYADIVYHAGHIRALAQSAHHVATTYDELWEPLWTLRFGDPLLDAETFRQEGGVLREIGGKPRSMDEIHGQYMGLLGFSPDGWNLLVDSCRALGEQVDRTDMTSFLRGLLAQGVPVGAVPVQGRWCEADNETDLQHYEQALANGHWTHDWR